MSLSSPVNKAREGDIENKEGIVSDKVDVLTLEIEDSKLIELADQWEKSWNDSKKKKDLEKRQLENERYWLGAHHTPAQLQTNKKEIVDNLIFESLETFLPVALRQNPEPMVYSDGTPEGQVLSRKVSDRLKDLADTLRLKLKLKKVARHWALYYLGCAKIGWSARHNEIDLQVKRPQQIILDPDAITDECEYEGTYLGEYRTDTAEDLISKYSEKKEYITKKVNSKLGTKLRYTEWWTSDILFWKIDEEILGKAKNPHWNYGSTTTNFMDEFGQLQQTEITESMRNHFDKPKVPFIFLSVFNLGKYPFDDTNLIEQVIPLQDVINKRQRQIDKNADMQNGGLVVSGDYYTKEQAKQASEAVRRGAAVWQPKGDVNRGYKRDQGVPLPQFIYQTLVDYRSELRNIFGTTGLSSQGLKQTETVRGKILVKGADADRATLVVDHLEQFADHIFNWMVQLMYVYYDEPHNVSRFQGATTLVNSELTRPLVVSVKEGSLIPKDRMTIANQSVDLATAGKMSLVDLYKNLEFPNPEELAANVWLETNAPQVLFQNDPRVQQVVAQQQATAATQMEQQRSQQLEDKMVDRESKMEQMDAKSTVDLMKSVPIQ